MGFKPTTQRLWVRRETHCTTSVKRREKIALVLSPWHKWFWMQEGCKF